MTTTNFDQHIDRCDCNSTKWFDAKKIYGEDVLPMWIADTDFLVAKPILDALQERLSHGILGYPSASCMDYSKLQNWLKSRYNWQTDLEWYSFSPGIVAGLSIAVQTFSNPGDKIIIQSPVYPPFFAVVKENGRELVENTLLLENNQYKIDFADLATKAKDAKILILCNPQNPVGRVWSVDELKQLAKIAIENDLIIFSDEIHCDLVYDNKKYTPLASISPEIADRTLTLMAPSKTFNIAGLFTSTIITSNKELREKIKHSFQLLRIHEFSILGATALKAAYEHGADWLSELLPYIKGNIDFLFEQLQQKTPKIKFIKPEGTYLVWLDCRELNLTDEQLHHFFAKEAKIGLNKGTTFGDCGSGFMRINLGCTRQTLEKAVAQITSAYQKRGF